LKDSTHFQPCDWGTPAVDTLRYLEVQVRELGNGIWVLEPTQEDHQRYQVCRLPDALRYDGMPLQLDLIVYQTIPHFRMAGRPASIGAIRRTPIR
jgi:hypothetical protein